MLRASPKAGEVCLLDQDSRNEISTMYVFLVKTKSSQQDCFPESFTEEKMEEAKWVISFEKGSRSIQTAKALHLSAWYKRQHSTVKAQVWF